MSLNNDKEFENLFKRSSEQYPLKTDSADWEDVLGKLEQKEEKKALAFRRKTLLTILLLLVVGIISSLVTDFIIRRSLQKKTNNKTATTKINTVDQGAKEENKIADAVYKKVIDSLKKYPNLSGANVNKKDITFRPAADSRNQKPGTKTTLINKINTPAFLKSSENKILQYNRLTNNKVAETEDKTVVIASGEKNPLPVSAGNNDTGKDTVQPTAGNNISHSVKTIHEPSILKNSAITKDTVKVAGTLKPKTGMPYLDKHFYMSALYAKDKSSVKLEPNRGSGYSWAVIAGYRFNKKLSIETGIHIEKKEYYTSGEHFINKMILPSTGKLLWVESENKLIEIPITLKADILNKGRHGLFATIGLSSYLVNREYYEFEEEINGVLSDGSVLYTNNTNTLFATTNFSLGYQFRIGKTGSLRIEPYLNLPLKGIGKSQEPIISRGIYLGWVYDFPKRKLKQ